MSTYQRMLSFARPYWHWMLAAVLCSLATAGLEVLSLRLAQEVLDKGFFNKDAVQAKHILWLTCLAIVGTMLLKSVFSYLADILNNSASNRIVADVRKRVFDQLMRLNLGYHQHEQVGSLSSRVTYDSTMMQAGVSDVVGRVIGSCIRIAALVGFIIYQNWRMAAEVMVLLPLAVGPLYYFGQRIRRHAHQDQERMASLTSVLNEALHGIKVVLAFGAQDHERERFNRSVDDHNWAVLKKLRYAAMSSPVMEVIGGLALALMLFLAGNNVINQSMTFGGFVALVGAMYSLYPQMKALNGVNVTIAGAMAAGQRIFALLDTVPTVQDRFEAQEAGPLRQGLTIENVHFSYATGEEVLRGLTFGLKAGERVALVGSSGAGKSTLADLVPRFHDVTGGRILWDGIDLRDLTQASLRAQIAVVAQDTFLFNESIAANIAYGRPGATQAQIEAAAKSAFAHDFIELQAEGYQTLVGERGARLSGGQRQRLAIARALLKDPPLLILDEATSALDTESERAVQAALEALMHGRSSLVIAHRLSTIRSADRIVVLDKGAVAEEGSHAELLAKNGLYAKLYNLQFADQEKEAMA
ncbi:MAG TPA: ABC transporter ATP-binding protein [bacterium]|nr:ABC transporter ATP-binding protein [bacterium]